MPPRGKQVTRASGPGCGRKRERSIVLHLERLGGSPPVDRPDDPRRYRDADGLASHHRDEQRAIAGAIDAEVVRVASHLRDRRSAPRKARSGASFKRELRLVGIILDARAKSAEHGLGAPRTVASLDVRGGHWRLTLAARLVVAPALCVRGKRDEQRRD